MNKKLLKKIILVPLAFFAFSGYAMDFPMVEVFNDVYYSDQRVLKDVTRNIKIKLSKNDFIPLKFILGNEKMLFINKSKLTGWWGTWESDRKKFEKMKMKSIKLGLTDIVNETIYRENNRYMMFYGVWLKLKKPIRQLQQ